VRGGRLEIELAAARDHGGAVAEVEEIVGVDVGLRRAIHVLRRNLDGRLRRSGRRFLLAREERADEKQGARRGAQGAGDEPRTRTRPVVAPAPRALRPAPSVAHAR
jgi:hypothetical protein